ncbi:IS66 family insertion sequence element accessory protein TnpB, partial [Nitrosomonas sp.]|uniref:IS66 family insertion sequence element accessory protein TnpB n=1 Tax=Nitrosomonas sp. TaxID=42353 RepID=UPI00272FDF3F
SSLQPLSGLARHVGSGKLKNLSNQIIRSTTNSYRSMANQRNVSGGLLPGTWFEYQDVWQLGSQASCRSGHSVACVGSGHDQVNAYASEYDMSSRSGRSCAGTAIDDFAALVGGVVEVSLITNPGEIWLMVAPVDMRRGIDGLSVLVEQALQRSPCSGSAFVFCNRASSRIKVLLWDGTGVWLCQRRLHRGRFVWGRSDTGGIVLTSSQWEWLIAGWVGVAWVAILREKI